MRGSICTGDENNPATWNIDQIAHSSAGPDSLVLITKLIFN
jgi:hypothetical protein